MYFARFPTAGHVERHLLKEKTIMKWMKIFVGALYFFAISICLLAIRGLAIEVPSR